MHSSGAGPLYTPRTRKHILENFSPTGLHVLVVDDDLLCLKVLERMLKQCSYKVTTCNEVNGALEILREREKEFDLVMSDVYMPDEDGFKLLEVIGLELDVPVIMISANSDLSIVMKGILHGACDYLIKPVRIEELRNIWQHVIRRKGKDFGRADPQEEISADPQAFESREEFHRKRKDVLEIPEVGVEDVTSSPKKARVNWSQQLHQQFVSAVNQLGVDKAVPKRILEIMNVQGLSRENVASHLQKYRLYLKRLSGVIPEPFPVASFQASEDGMPGGSMLVKSGRKGTEPSASVKGLNLGAGLISNSAKGSSVDLGTMNSLLQLKSSQQKQAANRAQVLSAIGVKGFPYDPSSSRAGLVRMASVDLGFLAQAAHHPACSSPGVPSVEVVYDLARFNINRSIKLEDDIVLPTPALGKCSRQSCMDSSTIAGDDEKQGGRISSSIDIRGPVYMQGLVEEAMKYEGDRMLSSVNQEGNVVFGLASSLFALSDNAALQADTTWSSSGEPTEPNYHQGKLRPLQVAGMKVALPREEALIEDLDMSAQQSLENSVEPSLGSTAKEMSGESFPDCSFEALIEDLGIISQAQQHVTVLQTNSDLLDVNEYLQLD